MTNRMREPAGDKDGRINPFARFSSSYFLRASSSNLESEYRGPKNGAVPFLSWNQWSHGRCGGSLFASASENIFGNSWYLVLTTVRPRFATRFDLAPHENFRCNSVFGYSSHTKVMYSESKKLHFNSINLLPVSDWRSEQ